MRRPAPAAEAATTSPPAHATASNAGSKGGEAQPCNRKGHAKVFTELVAKSAACVWVTGVDELMIEHTHKHSQYTVLQCSDGGFWARLEARNKEHGRRAQQQHAPQVRGVPEAAGVRGRIKPRRQARRQRPRHHSIHGTLAHSARLLACTTLSSLRPLDVGITWCKLTDTMHCLLV